MEVLAIIIFVVTIAVIALDRFHITVVALTGGMAMLALGIVDQQDAFFSQEFGIDHSVIFLLIGLMIVVHVLEGTGVFEWLSIKAIKLGRGHPYRMLILLAAVAAGASAFFNNLTTVLLVAPIAVMVARLLKVDAVPYLISVALASNIGGTATLIGDPPNIMIGSRAGLSFNDFLINVTPVIIIVFIAFVISIRVIWRGRLAVAPELREKVMELDATGAITDRRTLVEALAVLALMLFGFFFPDLLHLPPATVSLGGATLILLIRNDRARELLAGVDWETIFFFVGLFILVGGLAKSGVISDMAGRLIDLTRGSMLATSMVVLWASSLSSAVVDNIPIVATMNSMVVDVARSTYPHAGSLSQQLHQTGILAVWWALALGGCLGGNGTLVGASANLVVARIGNRNGFPISFRRFLLYGMPLMLESIVISMIYIYVRYFLIGGAG